MWEAGPEDHVDFMSDSLPGGAETRTGKEGHGSAGGTARRGPRHQPTARRRRSSKQSTAGRAAQPPALGVRLAGLPDACCAACARHSLPARTRHDCGLMLELTDRRVLLGHGLQRDTFIKAGASHRCARVLWANWGSGPARATPPDAPHPPPRHLVPLRCALRATLRLSGPAACSRSGEACFKDLWEKKETGGDHRPGPRCAQGWAVQTPGRPHARLLASAVSAGRPGGRGRCHCAPRTARRWPGQHKP